MIISSPSDFRLAAKKRLPPFLFEYIDGGSFSEITLASNCKNLENVILRQRVLQQIDQVSLQTHLFDQTWSMPIALAPVGILGMYAKRGEVQAAKAAEAMRIPFTLSTVSVCPIEEVVRQSHQPIWFQLYVLKDRGFMRHVLERAQASGITTLVFTADMSVAGARYRDAHSGMSGRYAQQKRLWQAVCHPRWAYQVGLLGRPHSLGNISTYLDKQIGLEDYRGWLNTNFDPTIGWKDIEWVREFWQGPVLIKGILDADDAKDAQRYGADGIVVSNHGGRQLDGVMSTAEALPHVVDAVGSDLPVLVDSGIRSGLDVIRMLALGAKGVLLGRSAVYALASYGQAGVLKLLKLYAEEMRIAMALAGVSSIADINSSVLVKRG